MARAAIDADRAYETIRYARRYQTIRGRAVYFVCGTRNRAKSKGWEHDLDADWIEDRLKPGLCEVTGIPFDFKPGGSGPNQPFAPSIDRIDPSRGYTKDNVQFVVWCYNAAKGSASHDDVMRLARALCNLT